MKSSAKWVFLTIPGVVQPKKDGPRIPDYTKLDDTLNDIEKTTLDNGFEVKESLKAAPKQEPDINPLEPITFTKEWIESNLKDWTTKRDNLTYFFVEHDKDFNPDTNEPTAKHFHIVIDFGKSPCKFDALKNRFPYGQIKPARYKIKSVQYLIHLNSEIKFKYDWSDVVTNGDINPYRVASKSTDAINLNKIYEAIQKDEITLWNATDKIPIALWAGNTRCIKAALEYRTEQITKNPHRKIKVFFLTGPSYSGKSHFAYTMAKKWYPDEEPADSSGDNDPWQDYKGQKVMILNDFRDTGSMSYTDVLKMLDANMRTSIKSRWTNKPFLGEVIFLTSVKPFTSWFIGNKKSGIGNEDPFQFWRRLQYVGNFSENYVTWSRWSDAEGKHVPAGRHKNTWSAKYCESQGFNKTEPVTPLKDLLAAGGVELTETYNSNTLKLETSEEKEP